jgi:mevalonate kinase
MTTASAPGKIILFGEHAVVYGHPALAVPVTQVHADVEVTDALRAGIQVEAPDVALRTELRTLAPTHPLRSVIENVFQSLGLSAPPYLNIRITSTIPVASGLGSGAAVSVAVIRALSAHFGHMLTNEQVNALAYEAEKLHHGTPSGIDNTVITYSCPVYFVRGRPVETFRSGAPFTIVIADTGIPAPTKESVGDVRKAWAADKRRWEKVFAKIGALAQQARKAIESGETNRLGPLMDENHALLQTLTVSSPELDRLVLMARAAGAEGAKLSGGGRGGNMIALVKPEKAEQVVSALVTAGAKRTLVTVVQA